MTHVQKMRNKLLDMENFIEEYIGIPKEEQYQQLYQWGEDWCEEKIFDYNESTKMMNEKIFWNWFKNQTYQIQFMFLQAIKRDKYGNVYLATVYDGKTNKVFDQKRIKEIYIMSMGEMILGRAYQSPTGDLAHHNFIKTITQK